LLKRPKLLITSDFVNNRGEIHFISVEITIDTDTNEDLFKNEAADLLYHLLILLKTKNLKLEDIELVLKNRVNLPRR
jgi:hypothetical protein